MEMWKDLHGGGPSFLAIKPLLWIRSNKLNTYYEALNKKQEGISSSYFYYTIIRKAGSTFFYYFILSFEEGFDPIKTAKIQHK